MASGWDPTSNKFPEEDTEPLSRIGFDVSGYIGKGFYGKVFRGVCNQMASKLIEVNVSTESVEGTGGHVSRQMKEVLLCGREFAIKWIKPLPKVNVLTEGKVLMRLDHPNVVEIFFVTQMNFTNHYVIMEFLNGHTLSDRLLDLQNKGNRMSQPDAKGMFVDLIEGLRYLHGQRVIHKDISVLNVMFHRVNPTDQGSPNILKYVDFNLAKEILPEVSQELFNGMAAEDIRNLGFVYDAIKRHTYFEDQSFNTNINHICIKMKCQSYSEVNLLYRELLEALIKTDRPVSQ